MTITAFAMYCEDIREEQDNQYSMIGCFKGHLTISVFPAILPRVAVLVSWMQTKDEERLPVRAKVIFREQDTDKVHVLSEHEISMPDSDQVIGPLLHTEIHIKIMNLPIATPGTFGVRLYRDDKETRLRGLPFVPAETMPIVSS